jgi:large subunit ribosomal protein L24
MKTINPGKQRKRMHNAPLHVKRKGVSAHLDENLLLKYDKRSVPVVKGDTIRVMRGNFRGHEDKVAKVNIKKGIVEIEGITMSKADGNKIAKPIHPSNVLITKLNLTDRWRRRRLETGLSEETRKEIEKEAQKQLREAEEEQKRLEEQRRIEELAEKEEEPTAEEEISEEKLVKEEPSEKEKTPVKKTTPKKQETKTTGQKKTQEKEKTSPKTPKKEEK